MFNCIKHEEVSWLKLRVAFPNMNTYEQREEKIILKDDIQDEVGSPFYDLSLVEFINTWRKV